MNEVIELTGPTVVHAFHVLDNRQRKVFRAEGGKSLRELAPKVNQATLCVYNGCFVLPEDMDWIPCFEDQVVYLVMPKGGAGNPSMAIIGAILIVIGIFVPGAQPLIYAGVGLLVSGLMPTPNFGPLNQTDATTPSPTYNIQLSGNSARLGQAIPVPYGRHILLPDFAAQPYTEFNEDGDQFYYALLCLGQLSKFTLESTMIDDTELSHFEDVEVQMIGPQYTGELSLVNPNVVNAPEVASQDMLFGSYIGPFASCGPGMRAEFIGIDIACPKGLYFADSDGNLGSKTVSWLVEARAITDKGAIAGDWTLLGGESLTESTNEAIRRSYKYAVSPGRYEIRVSRQDERDTNVRAGHDIQWAGMRAYLDLPNPLEITATFMALKIRASSQLSGLSQRRISVVVRRWLPTWNPTTGWSDPVETSSIAWALADVLRNQDYGGQVEDSRIDLQTLYELDLLWAERKDFFNAVFDKRITVWQALTTIARVGRARPIMRGSVFTFVRDGMQELPTAMFSMRNIKRGSFNIDYSLFNDDTTDGVELEYFNSNTWSSAYVTLPAPGVDEPINPARISMMGITEEMHAYRETAYMVADAAYRRSRISFTTELEGHLPAFGDLVAVSHDVTGWGTSGDVESWDQSAKLMICTENLPWTVGDHYAILVGPEGDVFGPYKVAPGSVQRSMQFIEVPDSDVDIYTGTERERTRFAMGPATSYAKMVKIVSITPSDNDMVEIKAIVEDNRVHFADEDYDDGGGGGGGGGDRVCRYAPDDCPAYDAASDEEHANYGFYSTPDNKVGAALDEGYTYAS